MDAKESDKKKIEVLKDAAYEIKSNMLKLTSIREDIHAINKEKWAEKIGEIKNDLGAKQTMLFIGPFSSGKSSFINAILGENILPTNDRPCTSVCTELRFKKDGSGNSGRIVKKDGSKTETVYDFNELIKMIDGPTGAIGDSAAYHHIELEYDISMLKNGNQNLNLLCEADVTIIDCPGYQSPYACSESIIEEYISHATHTFWMNPIDQFGGNFEINKIKDIRQKTTTLIPVFTKADLMPDEEERNVVRDLYSETIGGLFRHKEPIFTSAKKWEEGMKLSKENGSQQDIDELFRKSGIHNFLTAMVDATGSKEVTAAKVSSCRTQIDELIKELGQATEREQNHWKAKLQEIGWDEKQNVELNEAKHEAVEWIKNEAELTGRGISKHIEEEVVNYVCNAGDKLSEHVLLQKVTDVWKDEINSRRKAWSNELCKIYEERMKHLKFDDDRSFKIPEWLKGATINEKFTNEMMNLMKAVENAGLQAAGQGIVGAFLYSLAHISTDGLSIVKAKILSTIAPALNVGGLVLLGMAGFAIIPAYMRARADSKEKTRKEIERNVEEWLEHLNMTNTVESLLMSVNDETFNKLSAEDDKKADEFKRNYNTCGDIAYNLNEIHRNIIQQFSAA